MAKDDYYTFNSDPKDPKHFTCVVVDKDYDETKRYEINGSLCNCWAGHKWCRHKQMLVKFQKENLINSRKFWNHDKEKWLPPAQGAEQ